MGGAEKIPESKLKGQGLSRKRRINLGGEEGRPLRWEGRAPREAERWKLGGAPQTRGGRTRPRGGGGERTAGEGEGPGGEWNEGCAHVREGPRREHIGLFRRTRRKRGRGDGIWDEGSGQEQKKKCGRNASKRNNTSGGRAHKRQPRRGVGGGGSPRLGEGAPP